jgi:phosphate-selective porin OprO/OprP
LIAGLVLLPLAGARAQTAPDPYRNPEAAATSAADSSEPATPAKPDYLLPDLAPAALVYDGDHFWIRPIFAVVLDYTWFTQDDTSLSQVGVQDNKGEMRAGRLGFTLRSKSKFKWDFYTTVDYQEKKNREKETFQIYDLNIGLPLGPVKLTIGKMKEPINYELTALSVMLPQQERILLPFFPTRSIGIKFSGYLADNRVTWAAGVFNDYLDSGVGHGKNGNDVVSRVTGLVFESADKRNYLHLGLGYRRAGSDDGVMRFAGRPESNVADKFTDTGSFLADHADEISLELLLYHGAFSVLAERFDARVDSPETGDPRFWGYYVAGSWMLTGESRPYVRAGGYAGGVVPTRRCGALELVLKYSRVDLTDGTLDGGELGKWHVGLNWWASTQWKVGIGWGDADLDKRSLDGNTKMLLVRVQWLY